MDKITDLTSGICSIYKGNNSTPDSFFKASLKFQLTSDSLVRIADSEVALEGERDDHED